MRAGVRCQQPDRASSSQRSDPSMASTAPGGHHRDTRLH
jgi:hypothetical protein